jgi:hypothetical protein
MMIVPDIEFLVIMKPNTEGGRNWLAKRMMPENSMWNGVVVRSVECANHLANEAVADGLRISGAVEMYSYEKSRDDGAR